MLFNFRYKTIDPLTQKVTYQPLAYSTEITINKEHWNKDNQKIKTSFPDAKKLNFKLAELEDLIEKVYSKFAYEDTLPTPAMLREEMDIKLERKEAKKPIDKVRLVEYMEQAIEKEKDNKVLTKKRLTNYGTVITHLERYEAAKGRQLTIDALTDEVFLDFFGYLKLVGYMDKEVHKQYAINTLSGMGRIIKKFVREMQAAGIKVPMNPSSDRLEQPEETADSIYLNLDEIRKLYSLTFEDKALEKTRDLFVVACLTALRFSDTKRLNQIQIGQVVEAGNVYDTMRVLTSKTGEWVTLPCLKYVKELYSKYGGRFPKAGNINEFNDNLKVIGKMAGFTEEVIIQITRNTKVIETYKKYELLGTHTARRSAITNFYKMNVPVATIMRLSGHKQYETLQKYLRLNDNEHVALVFSKVAAAAPDLI